MDAVLSRWFSPEVSLPNLGDPKPITLPQPELRVPNARLCLETQSLGSGFPRLGFGILDPEPGLVDLEPRLAPRA